MGYIIDFLINWGYWGMLASAFLAGSFFPFSSEVVMSGLQAAGLDPIPLVIYGSIGNVLGSLFNYGVGRLGKMEWIEKYLHVKKEKLDQAERFMADRGAWMGFFAFIPILGSAITIVLGLTVAGQMTADKFVRPDTLLILALGLVAFVFDTAGGVLFAKLVNLFLPEGKKLNPMIGAAGISAFPMSGRVVNKLGLEEDNQNFLLMYSISVNVSGQIASVIAGGLLLTLLS